MTPLIIALQLAPPAATAPPPPPPPAAATAQPPSGPDAPTDAPPPSQPPAALRAQPPPAGAGSPPYGQPPPYGYPPYGQPPPYGYPPYGQPPVQRPPTQPADTLPPAERTEVTGFGRLELGLGTTGFGENNALLGEAGYGGARMWVTVDGAYMFHRHVGVGGFMGLHRRSSKPTRGGGSLNEVGYFIGAELPVLLVGERLYALHLTPRVGFLSGQIEIDNAVDAPFQNTVIFGGAFSFITFTYHLGASMGFMHAPAGSPGEIGRNHDYGGLYWALGGTIDG